MIPAPIRVFIVDDHPLVREWLSSLLREQRDLEVCGSAADAPQALASIVESDVDVAVVDLSLQNGSGLDLIKALKEQCPATDIVVLSMHEEVNYAERAFRAGARGYVMKRESTKHIVEAIRQVRNGRIFANAELLGAITDRIFGRTTPIAPNPVDRLSDRELEVFRRLGKGQSTRAMSKELGLSIPTVQTYCARIKEKLGLASGGELLREAVRWLERQNDQSSGGRSPPPS